MLSFLTEKTTLPIKNGQFQLLGLWSLLWHPRAAPPCAPPALGRLCGARGVGALREGAAHREWGLAQRASAAAPQALRLAPCFSCTQGGIRRTPSAQRS